MYTFPYHLCTAKSRIVLYGAGECGLDFYLQLHMNRYCDVVVWVDKRISCELPVPFDHINNIDRYKFDYIVIAIVDYSVAMQVKRELIHNGIDKNKIVWSAQYIMTNNFFPKDKEYLYQNFEFYLDIFDTYMGGGIEYGAEQYYQSSEKLHLLGSRPTEMRIDEYELKKYLNNESEVLNIGCNTGFLDLEIAGFVKKIVGVDINKGVIGVANKAATFLNIDNAKFECKDVFIEGIQHEYDGILLLAVHGAIDNDSMFIRIKDAIKIGGYLFFESHEIPEDKDKYNSRLRLLVNNGFSICWINAIRDVGVNRLYTVLKREN